MFITGYGIDPTSTTSGEPHVLNGASSRSASAGSPAWKTTSAASFVPEPSGACTSPAKTVRSSEASRHRVAVEAQQLRRGLDRMCDQPADDRPDRVQPVRERRRDAEVPAAAAQRPEEIRVRRSVDVEDVALCGDELDREQVVRREPVLRHQPAEAAAERVAGDPRPRDRASGDRETVPRGGVVQLAPEHAALGCRSRPGRIDGDRLHPGEVDHHAAVGDGAAGDVVPAAADRDLETSPARERERRNDVVRRPATHDHGGPAVDKAVVHGTRLVVARVLRAEDGTGDLVVQMRNQCAIQCCAHQLFLRVDGFLASIVEAAGGRSHRGDPPVFRAMRTGEHARMR